MGRLRQSACRRGHQLVDLNVYQEPCKGRECRCCRNMRNARYMKRRRAVLKVTTQKDVYNK